MSLFYTSESTLPRALAQITTSALRTAVGGVIYQRGEQYYASGAVEDISYTDSHTLDATVSGSEFYGIQIYLEGDSIDGDCDCPYDSGTCKHVVAVLLEAINEGDSIRGYMDAGNDAEGNDEIDENKQHDNKKSAASGVLPLRAVSNAGAPGAESMEFRDYVESLSVKELQNLVLQYAPSDFRRTVLTRSLSKENAEKVMKAAENNIRKIFDNDYLRHNNKKLEEALMQECERVRGLWEVLPERVGAMLVTIMRTIDEGFEEGDFYDDYRDDGFSSKKFDEYVVQFLRAVPPTAKAAIVADIQDVLASVGFAAFMNIEKRQAEWYTGAEIPAMKDEILKAIHLGKYAGNAEMDYKTISPELDDDERESMLLATYIHSNELTLELANLYERVTRPADAFDALDKRLQKHIKAGYVESLSAALFKKRFELAATLKESPKQYASRAEAVLKLSARAETVQSICKYLQHLGETALLQQLEAIAEKRDPEEFFRYLELEQRFDECWKRIEETGKLYDHTVYTFAVKRLNHEREQAKTVLLKRLATKIPLAEESAYRDVAETLKHLSDIDDEKAGEILLDLRTNYKRRLNLMKHLDAVFGKR